MPKIPALTFVRSGLSEGLSASESYRNYRDAARQLTEETGDRWTASRRQDFLRLYSQTSSLRGIAGDAMQAPKDQLPDRELIVPRDTVQARGYGTWVAIFQRTKGESDFLSTPFLIKSNQPLTPAEAEARALSYLSQEPDTYNRTVLGVAYTGTERFLPGG